MSDGRDDATAVGERTDLGAAIGREDLGADVLDVERARDGLAGVACLAAEEDGLDTCIMQPLHGGAGAGTEAVLEREQADEATAERDEQDAPPLRFELGGPGVGDGDADASPGGGRRGCRRSPCRRSARAR